MKNDNIKNVDRCVICGEIIPEGRQVCPQCYENYNKKQPFKVIFRKHHKQHIDKCRK